MKELQTLDLNKTMTTLPIVKKDLLFAPILVLLFLNGLPLVRISQVIFNYPLISNTFCLQIFVPVISVCIVLAIQTRSKTFFIAKIHFILIFGLTSHLIKIKYIIVITDLVNRDFFPNEIIS